jgi:dinuclear metal center YbgI/SA1388 family protein
MGKPLAEVTAALQAIAPLELAAEWDNVGLLLEPRADPRVARVLLTIDLTEAVLDEAQAQRCELIVAYHPPIFAPLARLTQARAAERIVLRAAAWGIAVHSPHTALDAARGGVNDWLADGLGAGSRRALVPHAEDAAVGQGREVVLAEPAGLSEVAARLKRHLGIQALRIASADPSAPVQRIALCAGAGGSMLAGCAADVWITGEMRHHDVLAALAQGTSVILSEHSHSERGYLAVLAARLRAALGSGVDVVVSRADAEPLRAG